MRVGRASCVSPSQGSHSLGERAEALGHGGQRVALRATGTLRPRTAAAQYHAAPPAGPLAQSTGGSLPPPLLQNRACAATRTRLLRSPIRVTDAPRPRDAGRSDLWQRRTMRPLHTLRRDRSGASGIATATHSDLLGAPASPSAYPGRYPRLWLLGGSLQHPHAGDPSARGREWCWFRRS